MNHKARDKVKKGKKQRMSQKEEDEQNPPESQSQRRMSGRRGRYSGVLEAKRIQ